MKVRYSRYSPVIEMSNTEMLEFNRSVLGVDVFMDLLKVLPLK